MTDQLNWDSLKAILEGDIRICREIARMQDTDRTRIRMDAQIEMVEKIQKSMATLETPAEVFCRSCGFTHPAGTEDCPRWRGDDPETFDQSAADYAAIERGNM